MLVSPSTEMQLNDSLAARLRARWRALLRDRRVCGEIGQHRGHVGMDHSRALGHSADGNQATADGVLKGDGFRAEVGCHDRPERHPGLHGR